MDLIEVVYHGDLPGEVLEYVEARNNARVLETSPLIIATREEAEVLPGLLGAIKRSTMRVDLIKVRRSGRHRN